MFSVMLGLHLFTFASYNLVTLGEEVEQGLKPLSNFVPSTFPSCLGPFHLIQPGQRTK